MRDIFLKTTRPAALCLVLLGTVAGCTTSRQLHHSTLAAGQTVSDMECKMVLNNLAMYHAQAGLLPDISQLVSCDIQVNDVLGLGNNNLTYSWSPWSWGVGMSAQRKVQEAWTIAPQTDYSVLTNLASMYLKHCTDSCYHYYTNCPPISDNLMGKYDRTYVSVNNEDRAELTHLILESLKVIVPPASIKTNAPKVGGAQIMEYLNVPTPPEQVSPNPRPIFIQ